MGHSVYIYIYMCMYMLLTGRFCQTNLCKGDYFNVFIFRSFYKSEILPLLFIVGVEDQEQCQRLPLCHVWPTLHLGHLTLVQWTLPFCTPLYILSSTSKWMVAYSSILFILWLGRKATNLPLSHHTSWYYSYYKHFQSKQSQTEMRIWSMVSQSLGDCFLCGIGMWDYCSG